MRGLLVTRMSFVVVDFVVTRSTPLSSKYICVSFHLKQDRNRKLKLPVSNLIFFQTLLYDFEYEHIQYKQISLITPHCTFSLHYGGSNLSEMSISLVQLSCISTDSS